MDKIASSYIALPDLIIVGVAIVLFRCLTSLPPNSVIGRVLALVCGFMILSIIVVIPLANNLSSNGVQMLSFIGICLALLLLQWNRGRAKANITSAPAQPRKLA